MYHTVLKAMLAASAFLATVYGGPVSLRNDFSISNGNPNGQWSYQNGNSNLPLQTPLNNGNTLYPALSTGYWGAGNNLNTDTPEIFKALVDGSSAGENNGDFLTGDIVAHSANDGSGLFARWTAPGAGTISTLGVSVWYGHSVVSRSNDFVLRDNATTLASGTVSTSQNSNRNSPFFQTVPTFSVVAGEVISLGLSKSSGQSSGSLAGMTLDFVFTPTVVATPEPATATFLGLALAAFAAARRRRV